MKDALVTLLKSTKTILIAVLVGALISWITLKVSTSENETLKKVAEIVSGQEDNLKKALEDSVDELLEETEDDKS